MIGSWWKVMDGLEAETLTMKGWGSGIRRLVTVLKNQSWMKNLVNLLASQCGRNPWSIVAVGSPSSITAATSDIV
ncbi:hypothetical protein QJS10_CPB22g00015 [Acorus calamus]|uniref:Uncharacterized protein n=1 Tax=Acorus calamus TaxID=4465 RepID=A0AAV9C1Z4_ACOCL|nr:hypothetical protein QJS10_CPB22g00015 [Acorus calamus]